MDPELLEETGAACTCRDCESVVSPAPYLVDLIDYVVRHVRKVEDGTEEHISIDYLVELFHQPFEAMPATACQSTEDVERQVRLCIEVLRRELDRPLEDEDAERSLEVAEADYRQAAYEALLEQIGTSVEELRMARSDADERESLADRLGIAEAHLYGEYPDPYDDEPRLYLDRDEVTEDRLEDLFGLANTNPPPDGIPEDIDTPRFEAWRQDYLRDIWTEQDYPTDPYSSVIAREKRLPIIDPDVIGPDDFRNPDPDTTPAFELWETRREWVDGQLTQLRGLLREGEEDEAGRVPDLEAMYTLMREGEIEHDGTSVAIRYAGEPRSPWADGPIPSDFQSTYDTLTEGNDTERIENARQKIRNLHLTVEEFIRLVQIQREDTRHHRDPRNDAVSDNQWRDVYSILVQAQKRALYPDWIDEESSEGIVLGPKTFWAPLREPAAGQWPPEQADDRPLIDPERIEQDNLPEPTADSAAVELWHDRQTTLDEKLDDIADAREGEGFNAMLTETYGAPPEPADWDDIDTWDEPDLWDEYLDARNEQLNSDDSDEAERALEDIERHLELSREDDLDLTRAEFTHLFEMWSRTDPASETQPPSESEWAALYATLTTNWKRKEKYAEWRDHERDTYPYWRLLKARLPPWRATPEKRNEWQQALEDRSRPPIVEPDIIHSREFVDPVSRDDAFALRTERQTWLGDELDGIDSLGSGDPDRDRLNEKLSTVIGVSSEKLEAVDRLRERDDEFTKRLDQLSLTNRAYSYLGRMIDLVDSGATVSESQWRNIDSILLQVAKHRQFAEWRREERNRGPTLLRPAVFELVSDVSVVPEEEDDPRRWRVDRDHRREWENTLEIRVDQLNTVEESIDDIVSAIEEEMLPQLRDALVMATTLPEHVTIPDGGELEAKAEWVTDRFLIDAKTDGCQETTRVAQAIETLQTFIFGIRTGQEELRTADEVSFVLTDEQFDERWVWLGSYSSWKAAMTTFLYPENLLLPRLRSSQTPKFKEVSEQLRANGNLSPVDACDYALKFSDYYSDVCSLEVDATCWAETPVTRGEDCNEEEISRVDMIYMFGFPSGRLSGFEERKLYWSRYDPSDEELRFWQPLTNNDDEPIGAGSSFSRIIGAASYDGEIFLFVSVTENGEESVAYTKYHPASGGSWSGLKSLPLPDGGPYSVVLVQKTSVNQPPELLALDESIVEMKSDHDKAGEWVNLKAGVFRPSGEFEQTGLYRAAIDPDTHGWAEERWAVYNHYSFGDRLQGAVEIDQGLVLFTRLSSQKIEYIADYWDGRRVIGSEGKRGTDAVREDEGFISPGYAYEGTDDLERMRDERVSELRRLTDFDGHLAAEFVESEPQFSSDDGLAFYRELGLRHPMTEDEEAYKIWYERDEGSEVKGFPIIPIHMIYSETTIPVVIAGLGSAWLGTFQWKSTGTVYPFWSELDPESDGGGSARASFYEALSVEEGARGYTWDRALGIEASPVKTPFSFLFDVYHFDDGERKHDTFSQDAISEVPVRYGSDESHDRMALMFQMGDGVEGSESYLQDLRREGDRLSQVSSPRKVTPRVNPGDSDKFTIPDDLSDERRRKELIEEAFLNNERRVGTIYDPGDDESLEGRLGFHSLQVYLQEAYYFVPISLALGLQRSGEYEAALDWFRTVYDYSIEEGKRKIYYELEEEEGFSTWLSRREDWLLDPLDVHAIASTRKEAYTRFTLFSIIRCLLEYADEEFTRDTKESLARARTLYMTALDLLEVLQSKQITDPCDDLGVRVATGVIPALEGGLDGGFDGSGGIDLQFDEPVLNIGDQAFTPSDLGIDEDILEAEYEVSGLEGMVGEFGPSFQALGDMIGQIDDFSKRRETVTAVKEILTNDHDTPLSDRVDRALDITETVTQQDQVPATYGEVLADSADSMPEAYSSVLAHNSMIQQLVSAREIAEQRFDQHVSAMSDTEGEDIPVTNGGDDQVTDGGEVSTVGYTTDILDPLTEDQGGGSSSPRYATILFEFCIPSNPILDTFRLRAENNLYKLRNCLNIAGMRRQVEPYAAPIDIESSLPTLKDGQLTLPRSVTHHPTPYRYQTLIDRAKELVNLAQQLESRLLSAIVARYQEAYKRLQARQDKKLARSGVRLQSRRVREAEQRVELAELQGEKARTRVEHYADLLAEGKLDEEKRALIGMNIAASLHASAGVLHGAKAAEAQTKQAVSFGILGGSGLGQMAAAQSSFATAASTRASVLRTKASYERRKQQWEFQKSLAQKEVAIGNQQVDIKESHVDVVEQEREIAEMKYEHAENVVEFLENKFINVELYEWMSDILEDVYRYFLQQATAMARLAESQLAFERQEIPQTIIQADYWEPPTRGQSTDPDDETTDRHGLTGSARLLRDIYKLDQYAFETDERKLQLTKTISLAREYPYEFERFRETGVLTFETPMEMFDRDFPGHYHRLVKRVRTSVLALIPPTEGIKATLSTTGISRVVTGNDTFQTRIVSRNPESVALTSPQDATGRFELQPTPEPEKLLPFESMGVDTRWEFKMPKAANQFDYDTIADVLLTIEYTALEDEGYRQQVIDELDDERSADRSFSFREEFADQWFDLNNVDPDADSISVRFTTRREDFLPNVENLMTEHLLLYFVGAEDGETADKVTGMATELSFSEQGGSESVSATSAPVEGVISTRSGSGGSWFSLTGMDPVGEWELSLPNTPDVRSLFEDEEIEDILFMVTYEGEMPDWPQGGVHRRS